MVVVGSRFTISVKIADVLAEKFASPEYCAVIECPPADILDNDSCAALLETVTVPKDVVPSRKVTVPVGVPPADGCTVTVKVTDWPNVAGFRLEATAVVVVA